MDIFSGYMDDASLQFYILFIWMCKVRDTLVLYY